MNKKGFGWSAFIIAIAVMVSVAALLFTLLSSVFQEEGRSEAVSSYNAIYSQTDSICQALPEESSYQSLTIPDVVEAIYAANSKRLPSNISQKTENRQISSGTYLCLKLKQEKPQCEELTCNVTFPYLGVRKTAQSLAQQILGQSPSQKIGLSFSRQQEGVVVREK